MMPPGNPGGGGGGGGWKKATPAQGGGAPPPLPGGNAANLQNGALKAQQAPGAPGQAVKPCNWKLDVRVHSVERFWPRGQFEVQFGAIKPVIGAKPDSLIPPINPWYKSAVKMVKKDAPVVQFSDCGQKVGGVTALVSKLNKEADWVLVDGPKSVTPLAKQNLAETINNADKHQVDLYLRHPLKLFLEFKFKDPEKKVFTFPKDFPVQVWSAEKLAEEKTDAKGRVAFELERKADWITLKFGDKQVYFTVGDGKADKCELKQDADRKAMIKAAEKFFSPPDSWSLVESIWEFSEAPKYVDGAPAYKKDEGKVYIFDKKTTNWVRRIGEKDAPITLTLDPHWQFNRFEYFDRYYGHTDHNHERVCIPPVEVDAMWLKKKAKIREGTGHWIISEDKAADAALAVPWIRQKTEKAKKSEKPDKDTYLQFKTEADTWAVSNSKTERKIETVAAGDKKLDPGADRLKYYDLPPKWESPKYWTRFGKGNKQEGKIWSDWDQAKLLTSRKIATPIIFSLDDIILTDAALNPLKMKEKDRFGIFYHRFKPDYDQKANVSNHGIYKPDKNEPYYSDVKLKGAQFNYLTDYPNWIRALAGNACLWDAFDKRTASGVLGARAAVQWYDPVASGAPANGPVGFQAPIDKTHFVLEPYYGQEHHRTWQQFNAGAFRIGRFDMALFRNCDVLAGKEFFLNMQYFRMFYNFTAASKVKGNAQTAYIKDSAIALMDRWNGNDAANASRAELVPQDATKNHTGELIWFLQPAKGLPDAHFRLDIKHAGPDARAWMSGTNGTGEVDDTYAKPAKMYGTALAYVLAHELGHGGSLPDEYGEWWNRCSHNGPGITCNIPADPFVDEGRDFDLSASLYGGANPPYPMMTMTVEMRNRYFWHNAEFARKFVKEALYSKHGAFPEYKLPGHPNFPRRSYVYWPVNAAIAANLGANGKGDVYLHAAGKEQYTLNLMPKGPYDAILSLLLRTALYEGAGNSAYFRNGMRNPMLAYNKKYYASGSVSVPTDNGNKDYDSAKSMFRFSPRYLIQEKDPTASNAKTWAADFNSLLVNPGVVFELHIVDGKKEALAYNKGTGRFDLTVDYSSPNANNKVAAYAEEVFRNMIGVAIDPKNPTKLAAGDLKSIAQAVFTKNGDVQDL